MAGDHIVWEEYGLTNVSLHTTPKRNHCEITLKEVLTPTKEITPKIEQPHQTEPIQVKERSHTSATKRNHTTEKPATKRSHQKEPIPTTERDHTRYQEYTKHKAHLHQTHHQAATKIRHTALIFHIHKVIHKKDSG